MDNMILWIQFFTFEQRPSPELGLHNKGIDETGQRTPFPGCRSSWLGVGRRTGHAVGGGGERHHGWSSLLDAVHAQLQVGEVEAEGDAEQEQGGQRDEEEAHPDVGVVVTRHGAREGHGHHLRVVVVLHYGVGLGTEKGRSIVLLCFILFDIIYKETLY